MLIQLEMGPEFETTVRELSAMGQAVREACTKGLKKGVKIASTRVISDYISGQSLSRRSGNLARSIDGWMDSPTDGIVGVRAGSTVAKYSWLLGDDEKTITPQNAKFLTIPIGEGLTGSGVARYSSPRQVPDGFFINKGGKLLFGYKNGKKGKFRPLFVLVKSVLVQGSGALYDGVLDSVDDMTKEINKEIDRRVGAA